MTSAPIDGGAMIAKVASELAAASIDLSGFTVRNATLDEVFLGLTGPSAIAPHVQDGEEA